MNTQTSDPKQSGDNVNPRRGRLLNSNPSGDPSTAPRCGARTRSGAPCRAPAMWSKRTQRYTRCRMHGGASTGPRTAEGLEQCRKANWKNGKRSRAWIAQRRAQAVEFRALLAEVQRCLSKAKAWLGTHERM